MFLKRLELYGFKSFGKKTQLEFGPGITAIVGPNGCGKSNVWDGIRWVLGEQSARTLRSSNMQDVIFAGSNGKRPLGMAEVSLTLDDCRSEMGLDFNEVTVTRRVYRSGESQYLINKSPCRLKDIHELFMDTGLGKEAFSLIGQGQIDAILNTRPVERRSLIEETAGIVKYQNRKAEARKKLDDTEEKLVRIDDIVTEVRRQLETLRQRAHRAQEYQKLAEELQEKGTRLAIWELSQVYREKASLERESERLQRELEAVTGRLTAAEQATGDIKQEIETLERELSQLQDRYLGCTQQINKTEHRRDIARERLEHNRNELRRWETTRVEAGNNRIKLRSELAACLWQLRSVRRRLAEKQQSITAAEKARQKHQKQADILEEIIDFFKKDIMNIRQETAGLEKQWENEKEKLLRMAERLSALKQRQEEIEREKESVNRRLSRQEKSLAEACRKQEEFKKKQREYQTQREVLASELATYRSRVHKLQEELQRLRSRFRALREMEREYAGYYQGVKTVMRVRRKRFPGICGVVAELIEVPDELGIAIENALGSAVQNIVTETDADAKAAIQFLKEQKGGRATFLPLDGLRFSLLPERYRQYLQGEDVVGLASQLVKYDPRYAPAVQYLLGRVIVTRTLDKAVALSKHIRGYNRIVTLEGDIISPGGAITGGSLSRNMGSGLLQRRQELASIVTQARQVKKELRKAREDCQIREDELAKLDRTEKSVIDELHQQALLIKELQKDQEATRRELTRWEKEEAGLQQEKEKLYQQMKEKKHAYRQQEKRLRNLRIEEQTREAHLEYAQKQLSHLAGEREAAQQELTQYKVDVASETSKLQALERERDRYRTSLQKQEDILAAAAASITAAQKKREMLQEEMNQASQYLEIRQAELVEIEAAIAAMRQRQKERLAVMECKKAEEKAARRQLEEIRRQVRSNERRLDKVTWEKNRWEEYLWDTYGVCPAAARQEQAAGEATDWDPEAVRHRVETLKQKLKEMGPVDTSVIAEYETLQKRHDYLCEQREDLIQARRQLLQAIDEIDATTRARFLATFERVRTEFRNMCQELFGGGSADLILTEADDLEQAGLEIMVRPPGKKLQDLQLLSGGERALAAIALLFAILRVKPSPFCVLDEVDAALDEANLERFVTVLREFAHHTQFVVITHRLPTMEAADSLYGVTMDKSGITQIVSVRLDAAATAGI